MEMSIGKYIRFRSNIQNIFYGKKQLENPLDKCKI